MLVLKIGSVYGRRLVRKGVSYVLFLYDLVKIDFLFLLFLDNFGGDFRF